MGPGITIDPLWASELATNISLAPTQCVTFQTNVISFVTAGQIVGSTSIVTTVTNWVRGGFCPEASDNQSLSGILGRGYFVVRDPVDNVQLVTRDGSGFFVGDHRYLVTGRGLRVQGFTDPGLREVGDLQIDNQYRPAGVGSDAQLRSYSFESDGRIVVTWSDGSKSVRGQILLQDFRNPSLLTKEAPRLWLMTEMAGPLPRPSPPNTQGLGSLILGQPQFDLTTPSLTLSEVSEESRGAVPGLIYRTEGPNDMAIRGKGFFILREPDSNIFHATRAGAFYIDPYGYLANYAGWRVQGYRDGDLTEIGDVVIDSTGQPATAHPDALVNRWDIDRSGVIQVVLSDGTSFRRGGILLQDCAVPRHLVRNRWCTYDRDLRSGPWTPLSEPGTAGLGWVIRGALEISELDEEVLSAPHRLNLPYPTQITLSDNPTDLVIQGGRGYFMVREAHTDVHYVTRRGRFHVDAAGFLVTTNGLRVQGFSDPALSIPGDVVLDARYAPATASPNSTVTRYNVTAEGEVWVTLSDRTVFRRGQILLQSFRNYAALRPEPDQLWSNLEAAMPMFAPGVPGSDATITGSIRANVIEVPPLTCPKIRLPPRSGVRLVVSGLSEIPWLVSVIESSSDLVHWDRVSEIYPRDIDQAEAYGPAPAPGATLAYRVRQWLDAGLSWPMYVDQDWSIGPFQLIGPPVAGGP